MNDTLNILVVILSIAFAVFLVVSIILAVYLIRVARRINRLADDASAVSKSAATAIRNLVGLVSPALIAKQIKKIANKFNKTNHQKGETKDDEA